MNKLEWIPMPDVKMWRGVLTSDKATTLALIKEKGPKDFELTCAMTRDDAEPRHVESLELAKNKAQSEVAEWVWRHAFEFIPSEIDARNTLADVRAAFVDLYARMAKHDGCSRYAPEDFIVMERARLAMIALDQARTSKI